MPDAYTPKPLAVGDRVLVRQECRQPFPEVALYRQWEYFDATIMAGPEQDRAGRTLWAVRLFDNPSGASYWWDAEYVHTQEVAEPPPDEAKGRPPLPGRIYAARYRKPPGQGTLNGFCFYNKMHESDEPYVREMLARMVVDAARQVHRDPQGGHWVELCQALAIYDEETRDG